MRIKKPDSGVLEGDLTPMIDMTFQLIAFFMVLINFAQSEQHAKVVLPESVLAKPPEAALEFPVTIQIGSTGEAYMGGDEPIQLDQIRPYLLREVNALKDQGLSPSEANVIIRAHKDAPTGQVQRLIKICQNAEFEKFALRAKEDLIAQ